MNGVAFDFMGFLVVTVLDIRVGGAHETAPRANL
jgi:hypothetical protein